MLHIRTLAVSIFAVAHLSLADVVAPPTHKGRNALPDTHKESGNSFNVMSANR
jgi:hypothetical protein